MSPTLSQLSPPVAEELEKLAAFQQHVSRKIQQEITARLQGFVLMPVRTSTQAPVLRERVPLVMRPGIPPRPLDPFYFEII